MQELENEDVCSKKKKATNGGSFKENLSKDAAGPIGGIAQGVERQDTGRDSSMWGGDGRFTYMT